MKTTVIVVVPCHFENENAICSTTRARIAKAVDFASEITKGDFAKNNVLFVATGNVPYSKDSETLADLIKKTLINTFLISPSNVIIGEGVGIFSEAKSVSSMLKNLSEVEPCFYVVSSKWYFWSGKIVWERYAKLNNFDVKMVYPPKFLDSGGIRTKAMYLVYGLIVRCADTFGLMNRTEKFFTKLQSKRKEGFTLNGCA